jgi:hypothetical protein
MFWSGLVKCVKEVESGCQESYVALKGEKLDQLQP